MGWRAFLLCEVLFVKGEGKIGNTESYSRVRLVRFIDPDLQCGSKLRMT